jgi:hypothetical protein
MFRLILLCKMSRGQIDIDTDIYISIQTLNLELVQAIILDIYR